MIGHFRNKLCYKLSIKERPSQTLASMFHLNGHGQSLLKKKFRYLCMAQTIGHKIDTR